jgi:hypothetical protein
VGIQTASAEILLVYGGGKLKGGDGKLADHLLQNGYTLTLLSDEEVTEEDAQGKDLVILSDSVDAGLLGPMFRDVKVPVLCAEHQQLDDLGLTSAQSGLDYGKASGRQTVKITDSSNTLSAGLSGSVQVTTEDCSMGWGVPGPSAVKVGLLGESSPSGQKYALFEYEVGSAMPGLVAPAKRIGLLLSTKAWSRMTPKGQSLVDTAVDHAVRATSGGCGPCQSGEHSVQLVNNTGEKIWVGVWDKVNNRGVSAPTGCVKDWEMGAGDHKTVCVPKGANYRFFPRSGCKDEAGAWKDICDTNDCNYPQSHPAQAVCSNGGLQSLAEINFDNEPIISNEAWYDVSYVDGYTYPVTVTIDNVDACKSLQAGCSNSLGACPWATRDSKGVLGGSVCWGGCKEIWARANLDGLPNPPTQKQLTAVCCTCPAPYGCADTGCNSGGCGCSPHASYPSSYSGRVCCSPIPDLEAPYVTPCASDGHCTWPSEYTAYPRQIKGKCDNSYAWQFHDDVGLMHCTAGKQPYNFTVTFWPK